MKSVVFYGNCQSTVLAKMFRAKCSKDISVLTVYNNPKSGYVPSDEAVDEIFQKADLIVYQPLSNKHVFSHERLQSCYRNSIKLTFPYVYNNAFASLVKKGEGELGFYGEDQLLDVAKSNGFDFFKKIVEKDQIETNIKNRFLLSNSMLEEKERVCDLRVSKFIENNITEFPIFDTRNHPTFPVFVELFNQLSSILELKNSPFQPFSKSLSWPGLPTDAVCLSSVDSDIMGIKYGYHRSWKQAFISLVEKRLVSSNVAMIGFDTTYPRAKKSYKLKSFIDKSQAELSMLKNNVDSKGLDNVEQDLSLEIILKFNEGMYETTLRLIEKLDEWENIHRIMYLLASLAADEHDERKLKKLKHELEMSISEIVDIKAEQFVQLRLPTFDAYSKELVMFFLPLFSKNSLCLGACLLWALNNNCDEDALLILNNRATKVQEHQLVYALNSREKFSLTLLKAMAEYYREGNEVRVIRSIANRLFDNKELDVSKQLFERAILLDKENPNSYVRLAQILKRQKELNYAEESIIKAIEYGAKMPEFEKHMPTLHKIKDDIKIQRNSN